MSNAIKLLFISVFFIHYKLCFAAKTTPVQAKLESLSAPYVSVLTQIGICENPTASYTKKSVFSLDLSIKKNNIVKGNVTILGKTYNLKVIIREFFYEDGKWVVSFNANNISCRSTFIAIMADLLGFIYNKKTCVVSKGSYVFEVDYNKVDHIWTSRKEFGRMMRTLEVRSKAGTELCVELESVVRPVKA